MRFGLDVTPLCGAASPGVRRAVEGWLRGLPAALEGPDEAVLFAPGLPERGELVGSGDRAPPRIAAGRAALADVRRFRRRLGGLAEAQGVAVLHSPWAAIPRARVPLVATVHELPFVRAGPVEGRVRAWRHRFAVARAARRCAAIVVPSRATRDDLLRLHPRLDGRVHVVRHGFDPQPWGGRAALPSFSPHPYAVLVGATHRRKGIHVLLDALADLRDLDLAWLLVGRPDPAAARRIDRLVPQRLRRGQRPTRANTVAEAGGILVCEGVGDADLATLLRSARLLVYPSLSEGFGFPPLEAMAAGIPVVATTAGSIPEVCGDAAVLVPPGDPGALAAAVRRVHGDEDLRFALIGRGAHRARAFPPEASARALLAVLRRAAAEGRR